MNTIWKFLIIMGLVACSSTSKDEAQPLAEQSNLHDEVVLTEKQQATIQLTTIQLQDKQLSSYVETTGKISLPPDGQITVTAPLGGYLKSTKLLIGMPVKKGEVLAVVENQKYIELQHSYLTAKNQLMLKDREYKRQKQLNENKASSDREFELAKTDYDLARLEIRSLEEQLRLIGIQPNALTIENMSKSITLRSPIDGIVASVNGNVGKFYLAEEVLFELIEVKQIYASLTVFDKDVDKIKVNQRVTILSNSNPNEKHPASVQYIGRNLSENSSIELICKFDSYSPSLLPGKFVNAIIDLSNTEVRALPESAIVRFDDKQFVFTQTNATKFNMEEVQIGTVENGYVEIKNASQLEGKQVVDKGAYDLLMVLKNTEEE